MADSSGMSSQTRGLEEHGEGEGGRDAGGCLTEVQREMMERCLHALRHAKNDSHTLAALLMVSIYVYVNSQIHVTAYSN